MTLRVILEHDTDGWRGWTNSVPVEVIIVWREQGWADRVVCLTRPDLVRDEDEG